MSTSVQKVQRAVGTVTGHPDLVEVGGRSEHLIFAGFFSSGGVWKQLKQVEQLRGVPGSVALLDICHLVVDE